MTNRLKLVSLLVVLIIAAQSLAACAPDPVVTTPPTPDVNLPPAETPQAVVDNLRAIQPVGIPEHLQEYDCVKTGEDFDVNDYFSVLPHLSMEPGYVLDYVYFYDFMGGRPIIYVREADREPFANYSEYEEAAEQREKIENVYDLVALVMYGDSTGLGNKIHIDDTEEGYFEYVALYMMGGQFYLWWHSNYDDAVMVCSQDALEKVLTAGDFDDLPLPEDVQKAARKLDVTPIIELQDDVAIVTFIFFTKWGGFVRISFTVSRDYPHTIVDVTSEVVVEYQCGVSF